MSVLLPCATTSDFGAVGCGSDGELYLDALTRQLIRERYEFRFVATPRGRGGAGAGARSKTAARCPLASPPSTVCSRAGGLLPNRPNRPHGCRTS